jgi:hypothetical protein
MMPHSSPEARNAYARKRYAENATAREAHKALVAANNRARYEQVRRLIAEAKTDGCSRCDEDHPAALDFHHIDPATKSFNLNRAGRHSDAKVLEEIAKCIVLCANCHRKEHVLE